MVDKRCALVTNACDFAGPAAVAALSAANFQVIAHDRSFIEDHQRANFQHRHPDAILFDEQEPEALVEAVWTRMGAVEVLVSNDHHPARHVDIESASVSDLRANLDMLVVRPFRLIKAVVPYFRAAKSGRIVLITSCRTKLPMAGGAAPDAARDAANALVRSLAIDLAPQGISVTQWRPTIYIARHIIRTRPLSMPLRAVPMSRRSYRLGGLGVRTRSARSSHFLLPTTRAS